MKPVCRFEAETVIEAGIERVYAFHENPHNIREISPRWQQAEVLAADPVARVGGEFHFKLRLCGVISLEWVGVWQEATRPTCLIDEEIRGPFASWRHQHRFVALDDGHTRMIDHVEYCFFGGWAGKIFGETLGRIQFWLMFADRHARTRKRLREQR